MAAKLQPGEEVLEGQSKSQVVRIRTIVANVFTFVRSQEINRTISSFTFDHYITEAKRRIKGEGRQLRNAAGEVYGVRPSKLEALEALETEFNESFPVLEALAEAVAELDELENLVVEPT